jgi:hypothetical protein
MTKIDQSHSQQVFPSQFMRELRPENYSDTEDRTAYLLEAPVLEYHLESITKRNQTHEFEIFCRKLCERTICPNLRAHTGPDGGGDSKADTETYPVADEIAALFYVGKTDAGRERWAFAFSAKETWKGKVRDDVKGIIGTDRDYKRIVCVTSRFARDKDRANLEDELSKEYGVPVTIQDRSWIVKEIIENERKDLAYNYLNVGEEKNDPLRLGPKDYSRTRQLEDIEHSLDDPEEYQGIERQRVTETLIAAKLSRHLERPRPETDGRFLRAIRLADKDGTYRQKLETRYEHIWTAYWWFDDFQFLNESYTAFETLALQSDSASELEFSCNLLQLLSNSVIHGHISSDECKLDERTATLKQALEQITDEKDRPNNSLEAQISLLIIQVNQCIINKKNEELVDIWNEFFVILEKAIGLGEFNADRMVSMIEVFGRIAGNDPAYNNLIEKTAEFIAKRKSEAEGALTLLRRAQQLDLSDNKFDMIRFLGKAVAGLSKREYSEYLIDALVRLTYAYRSAGMLWAARGTCIFLAGALVIKGEEESELPISIVPTMKQLAWLALELRHLPDFLYSIQLLNGAVTVLPLSEDSKLKVKEDIFELDAALGCLLLNLEENDLRKLGKLPDILAALGLFTARAALLYQLGYTDILRSDGSFPESESDEELARCFSSLANQPAAQELRGSIILNTEDPQTLSTKIIGMTVEVNIEGNLQSILIAEAVLGSLEAFFSTAIEHRIVPHTEKLSINLLENDDAQNPSFKLDPMEMTGTLLWPSALSLITFEHQLDIQKILTDISSHIIAKSCFIAVSGCMVIKKN